MDDGFGVVGGWFW